MADSVKNIEIRQYDGSSYDSLLYPKTTAENVIYNETTVQEQLSTNISNIATNTSDISDLAENRLVKPSTSGILVYDGSGTSTSTVTNISTSDGIVEGATGLVTGNAVYQANAQIVNTVIESPSILSSTTKEKFVTSGISTTAPTNPDESFNALTNYMPSSSTVVLNNVYTTNARNMKIPVQDLSVARTCVQGASVGNYALFAGGYTGSSSYPSTVDAYDTSLTRSTTTTLSAGRSGHIGVTIGNYALFAGGLGSSVLSSVNAYNTSLTRSTPTSLSAARKEFDATSISGYALFGPGYTGAYDDSGYTTIDAYNTSLTRSIPTKLTKLTDGCCAASAGTSYALFCGGYTKDSSSSTSWTTSNVVTAYNTSLTKSTPTALGNASGGRSGATAGTYAIIAGASYADKYTASLTRSAGTALSVSLTAPATVSVSWGAIFAGQYARSQSSGSGTATAVNGYNTSATLSILEELSPSVSSLGGASVNNYALFAGPKTASAAVQGYDTTSSYKLDITVPSYCAYYIDGTTTSETETSKEVNVVAYSRSAFNGYIKYTTTLTGAI